MAQMIGADPEALDTLAQQMQSAADELDGHSSGLTALLGGIDWIGDFASRFIGSWGGTHRVNLSSTSQFIRDAARQLSEQAAEQRGASDSDGGGSGPGSGGPSGGPPSGGGSGQSPEDREFLDTLSDLLADMGIVLSAAELAELANVLDGLPTDELQAFLDAVEGSPILDFIDAAGSVLDVGGLLTDAITDFVEHPDLPLDERLIHAGVEAALKFGASEGIDKAFTALGTAIGGPAGFVLGKGAGFVADLLFSQADDAFNITENAADVLTEFIVDPVGTVEAIGEAAIDFLQDAPGEVVDFFGDLIPDDIPYVPFI